MDEVGPGFQPAGAFQARCPLTGKVPTPRRSTAAAQKGWPHFLHELLGQETGRAGEVSMSRIGSQPRRPGVRLQQPDRAIGIVAPELLIFSASQIASPYNP